LYSFSIVTSAALSTRRQPATAPARLTPAQVRALVGPARQEIVDVLESAGPCSVAQLGALLGRPADALYHHLRRLVRVGLVAELEQRRNGRHVFAVYDLRVRPIRLTYAHPIRPSDIERVVSAAQRLTWREFRRALASGTAVTEGPRRNLRGGRAKGWATPQRLARVNQLLAELMATVSAGAPEAGAAPISLSFVLAPSSAKPVGRRARASAGRPNERKQRP
jgi:DNA-binding transcriptional ArsR family regulator